MTVMINFRQSLTILLFAILSLPVLAQQNEVIVVNASKPVAPISPTMWGVFFEDINMGADGGIYAELIKNRSFEFSKPLMGWSIKGKKPNEGDVLVLNRQEANTANPRFLRVNLHQGTKREWGIANEGFKGMGIKKDLNYEFSLLFRQQTKATTLHIEFTNEDNKPIGGTALKLVGEPGEWHRQSINFKATAAAAKAKFTIWFEGSGLVDLDMISLFPSDTWKGRKGGMRADMIQMLADMKPGFIRFPGGCIVEGIDLANRYQWKKTLGPLEERQLIMNRWNVEFAHRAAPDYFQTFGLGFFEYFQLAEDIGAEPVPILNCGMACQFNTAELVPMEQLDPYVQDALDLIEFANGDETTQWGRVRIGMGHTAPFNLKYLGVGNENWGPQYIERSKIFQQAIKAKYPTIKLIYSSGTNPESDRFRYLDTALRSMKADVIDEHYYMPPNWFLTNASRYDNYDRKGPKIFAGEYAAHVEGKAVGSSRNLWQAAIAEAAFMTGLERNAGVVEMASYAPLFAHAEGWQWAPDLIWLDNLNIYGTPSYYVQKMFSTNKGTQVLDAFINQKAIAGADQLYISAVRDEAKKELIVKIVNTDTKPKTKKITFQGAKLAKAATLLTMKGNLNDQNTLDDPSLISPKEETFKLKGNSTTILLPPNSFSLLKVAYQ